MADAQALKTIADVDKLYDLLLKRKGTLHADIWKIGVNLPLRISDLLSITRKEALNAVNIGYVRLKNQKNQKYQQMKLNTTAKFFIKRRIEERPNDKFLFQTPPRTKNTKEKQITRQAVYDAFHAQSYDMGVNISTHTMRKTRGRFLYEKGVPIAKISMILNHSTEAVTMVYLGITQDELDETFDDLNL